jgi:hypothetical protein
MYLRESSRDPNEPLLNPSIVTTKVVFGLLLLLLSCTVAIIAAFRHYDDKAVELNTFVEDIKIGDSRQELIHKITQRDYQFEQSQNGITIVERVGLDRWIINFSFNESDLLQRKQILDADLTLVPF